MQRIEACVLKHGYELLEGIRWLANRWHCYIRCSNLQHIGAILGTELGYSQSIMENNLTAPIDRQFANDCLHRVSLRSPGTLHENGTSMTLSEGSQVLDREGLKQTASDKTK